MFKTLRPLAPYLEKYRKTFAIGALCVLCHNVIWICFPIVLGRTINDLNGHFTTTDAC